MKKTITLLRLQLAAYLAIALVVALLYETGTLTEGALVADTMAGPQVEAQLAMTVLTIVCVPVALKLFHLQPVARRLADESRAQHELLRWGSLRLALLGLPLVVNLLCYYLFGADVRFFYLAVITLLALAFASPTSK